jgi:hypothetical protein
MASYQPELHTAQEVLDYYDGFDTAAYSVYVGHKVEPRNGRYSYSGDDKNEGKEQLSNALTALLSNPENTNTYCIAMLEKKGKKIEDVNSISFQLNKRQSLQPYQPQQINGYQNSALIGELNSLKSQIAALQMKLDEEDEEDEEDEPEEGGLAGFFKNPVMQNMLIQQLQGMFMPNTTKVTNVAGVLDGVESDQDQKIDEAIETLKQYTPNLGDDLILLAQIALNDPQQFKFLLKMLRS